MPGVHDELANKAALDMEVDPDVNAVQPLDHVLILTHEPRIIHSIEIDVRIPLVPLVVPHDEAFPSGLEHIGFVVFD